LFLQYVNSIEGVNLIWQPYEIENGTVEFKSYVLYKGTDSLNLQPFDTVSSSLNAYTDKDPNALTRLTYYRIGGLLYNPCNSQILLKAGGGPFVEALSNIEDNRLRSGNGIGSVAFANIIVYPQPAKDFVNISFNIKKQKEIRILLTDLMGKTIDYINFNDITLGNKTIRINFDKYNFKSGIYILKFLSDNEQQLIKLNIIR